MPDLNDDNVLSSQGDRLSPRTEAMWPISTKFPCCISVAGLFRATWWKNAQPTVFVDLEPSGKDCRTSVNTCRNISEMMIGRRPTLCLRHLKACSCQHQLHCQARQRCFMRLEKCNYHAGDENSNFEFIAAQSLLPSSLEPILSAPFMCSLHWQQLCYLIF